MSIQFKEKSQQIFNKIGVDPQQESWQLNFDTLKNSISKTEVEKNHLLRDLKELDSQSNSIASEEEQVDEDLPVKNTLIQDIDSQIQQEFGKNMQGTEYQRIRNILDKELEYDDNDNIAIETYSIDPKEQIFEQVQSIDPSNIQEIQETHNMKDQTKEGDFLEIGKDAFISRDQPYYRETPLKQDETEKQLIINKINQVGNSRRSKVPDYLINPNKYRRYELDESIEVGQGLLQINPKEDVNKFEQLSNNKDSLSETSNDMDRPIQFQKQSYPTTQSQKSPRKSTSIQHTLNQSKHLRDQYYQELDNDNSVVVQQDGNQLVKQQLNQDPDIQQKQLTKQNKQSRKYRKSAIQ